MYLGASMNDFADQGGRQPDPAEQQSCDLLGEDHRWPDDLTDPDAYCDRCGLAYAEWSA